MLPEIELKEGWTTVVLLMLICLCVAWAIQSAQWTDGLAILQGVVLLGGGLGILLAKSRLPNRMAHLLSILAGFTWSVYLLGRLLAQTTELPVSAALVALDWRLQSWVTTLVNKGSINDNYAFVLTMCFLMWAMAYVSAWTIFRWQRAWWAVIICGLAMMLNNIYSSESLNGYLIAFLFFALLLVVRTNVAFHEQEWRVARVAYNSELVFSFLRAGLIISVLAILLAWATPRALASRPFEQMWVKIGEPWRRFQDQSSRVFGNLNYQNPPTYIYSDRSVRFGGPVKLGDTPIIDVESSVGRYWRVMVYHEYTGTGWNNTDTDTLLLDAGEQGLAVPSFDLRREVTQTIILRQDLGPDGIIAAASQPLKSQLPLRAVVSLVTQPNELSLSPHEVPSYVLPGDPSVLYSQQALQAGESYQVTSSMSIADEESLRDAGGGYPDWVVPRYLQLPESLPERVRLLAREITEGQTSAYDKAVAIERYLRNFPYNDQIAGPGPAQDGVDYFLFDAKEGYCDYYASAMVVMLRSVGVPARYVRGYSQGEKGEDGLYHVREWDGHAWPEVFFPGYGWIEFEPTAGEPALIRPSSREEAGDEGIASDLDRFPHRSGGPIPDYELEPEPSGVGYEVAPKPLWQRLGRGFWLSLDLSVMVLALAALFRVRRRRHIADLSVAERAFEDLVEWVGRLLHIELLAHQTPYEYAAEVGQAVPRASQAMEQIADSYARERFGKIEVSEADTEAAWSQSWRALWRRWGERKAEPVRRFWHWLVPPKET
jgi:transglutaminase-like putative cysteine protease